MVKKKIAAFLLCIAIILTLVSANVFVTGADFDYGYCSEEFIVKDNMELYTTDTELNSNWKSNSSSVSLTLEKNTTKTYLGEGNSLKCSYDIRDAATDKFNFYSVNPLYNEDKNGEYLGFDSRLGFWIYTEYDIQLYLTALEDGNLIITSPITVKAGKSFLHFDWTDFSNSKNCRYNSLSQLSLSITPSRAMGNIWIDQLGLEKTNYGSDTHSEGVYEIELNSTWTNNSTSSLSLSYVQDEIYYKNETNLEKNQTSLKINYSNITNTTKANFRYDAALRIGRDAIIEGEVSNNLYGKNTVFTLWVRADRPLNLEFSYSDRNLSKQSISSDKYNCTLRAGENLVKIPLESIMRGKNASYYWVYQPSFTISNTMDTTVSGKVYIDAVGFYNGNTDNVFAEKISEITEITPETADEINELVYYYKELTDSEKKNITNRTMYQYESIVGKYKSIAPTVEFADTLNDNPIYHNGTLTFDVKIDNKPKEYTLFKIGAVMHRRALNDKPHKLDIKTENAVFAETFVKAGSENYSQNIIFKCFDGATPEDIEKYLSTNYIVRPFVAYKSQTGDVNYVYGDVTELSSIETWEDNENMIKAYDNNLDTSWVVNAAGNYTLDIEFPSNKEFDCIDFNEKSQGEYIYTNDQGVSEPTGVQTYGIINYNVQISSDGTSWQTIYVQDEMGLRKAVLPQTYSAKYMRLNITTDMPAAINEVSVGNIGKYDKKMRVVSYLNKHEDISGYEGNIEALTDIILINYGLWNSKGEFEFIETDSDNGTLTKTKLKSRIEEIKKINSKINIWFSFSKFTLAENEKKTELFTATTNKAALINTCLQLCEEYGFYGIDFDFEFPAGQAQTKGYNEFLVDLGKTLHSNGYKLSVATSNYVDHKLSAPYIDYVNLMTYDGVKFDRFGRHNTYNAIVRQINRMESNGFSRDQIVLGLGYYGRVNGGSAQMSYKSLAYRYYDAVISGMNVYDSEYYCAGTSANADKVILALDNNLCGVFSWTMATDLPITNEFSLARSVDRTIERFSSKY